MMKDMKQDIKTNQKIVSRPRDYSLEHPENPSIEGLSVDLEGSAEILSFLEKLEERTKSHLVTIQNLKENISKKYDSGNEKYVDELLNEVVKLTVKNEYGVSILQDMISVLDKIRTQNKLKNDTEKEENELEITPSSVKYYVGNDPVFYYFRMPKLIKYDDELNSATKKMLGTSIKKTLRRISSQIVLSEKFTRPFDKFTIIFVHHIIPNPYQGDTDNFNIKQPIDGINGNLIVNDSSLRSHIFQITKLDYAEYTEMYILDGHEISAELLVQIASKYEVEIS